MTSDVVRNYQKVPVTVSAIQLTAENMPQVEQWCNGSIKGTKLPVNERIININTLEGEMTANIGDYIIKGIKGEFYPCKADIFNLTYVRK